MAEFKNIWAVILGASSGFGEASCLELSRNGYHIFGVHLDRKATMPNIERIIGEIQMNGRQAIFFNINAADSEQRKTVCDQIEKKIKETPESTIRVLMHSLAFGALKPFVGEKPEDALNQDQFDMTLNVMANSLVYWTRDLINRDLMVEGGRIFAMTSSGGARVMPAYGAVSGAKAALESHIRQLAFELASRGITANAIRAGVTDTPALRKIPQNDLLLDFALKRNPSGRLTTPADVAKCIAVLAQANTYWMTGNTIGVDGGEDVVG